MFDIDVEFEDARRRTLISFAVFYDALETTRLLLSLDVCTAKIDNDGWSVWQTDNDETKQLLLEHSKKTVSSVCLLVNERCFVLFCFCFYMQKFSFTRLRCVTQELQRKQTRLETMNRIRNNIGIRLMRFAQPIIVGICLALASLELPPYILLWIVDWLPRFDKLSHHKKIQLITSVRDSILKVRVR